MIHGTKKQKSIKTEQELKDEEELSNKINAKLADFFLIRNKPFTDEQIPKYLQFTALLMQLCSDISTIFNFRRELLEREIKIIHQVSSATDTTDQTFHETIREREGECLAKELKLVTKLIKSDPKSYTLWNFRQWLVVKLYSLNKKVIDEEKLLCKMLLLKDEKNFHVWNYRNWVNSVGMDIDEEITFTEEKIKSNPFNFSPYHFRSKHLATKYIAAYGYPETSEELKAEIQTFGMPKAVFDQQMQTIKTAVYLNPMQEAPWTYYRWLLKRLLPVIILSKKKLSEGNIYSVILNQKIKPSSLKRVFGQKQLSHQGENGDGDELDFCVDIVLSSENCDLQIVSNCELIEASGIFKNTIEKTNKKQIDLIRSIFEAEEAFIRQVIEQEPTCRFAWLQVLQIIKNQLMLTCSSESEWKIHAEKGLIAFETLSKQEKTVHYISRIREYWQRINKRSELTEQQKAMIVS